MEFTEDELLGEQWRAIPGFSGYEASSLGRVRSFRKRGGNVPGLMVPSPRLLKQNSRKPGYHTVSLYRDGEMLTCRVNVLVLEAFVGPRGPGEESCHFPDASKSNNRLSNLRWGTHAANIAHRDVRGNPTRGHGNGRALLSPSAVASIRAHRGFLTIGHLAEVFDVSASTVQSAQSGKSYAA